MGVAVAVQRLDVVPARRGGAQGAHDLAQRGERDVPLAGSKAATRDWRCASTVAGAASTWASGATVATGPAGAGVLGAPSAVAPGAQRARRP